MLHLLLDCWVATAVCDEALVSRHYAEVGVRALGLLLLLLGVDLRLKRWLLLLLGCATVQIEHCALSGDRPAKMGRIHGALDIRLTGMEFVVLVGVAERKLGIGDACLDVRLHS